MKIGYEGDLKAKMDLNTIYLKEYFNKQGKSDERELSSKMVKKE
jgi:hypothetical protein